MERPFRELHELYKIVLERAEARAKAEEERKEQEELDRINEERAKKGLSPIKRKTSTDANANGKEITGSVSSFADTDDIEEAFEEMAEGGA